MYAQKNWCLICQVKNQQKNQFMIKDKITKPPRLKTMIYSMVQTGLFLKLNIITDIVVHSFKIKVLVIIVIWYKHDGAIWSK